MTFEPDSPLVQRVVPSLGHRRGVYLPRTRDPVATTMHTTGSGPGRRYRDRKQRERHGWRDPFDAALTIYERMMEPGPQYLIGQARHQVAQLCPESECAWGVGSRGGRAYGRELARWVTKDTAWWMREWPHLNSPRELAGGLLWLPYDPPRGLRDKLSRARFWAWEGGGSVNANVIHIEVVPPLDDPTGPWSEHAWRNLVDLVTDIHGRHRIRLAQEHVVSHSSAHPLARSARGAPWDPGPSQWSWGEFAVRAGIPPWDPPPIEA